MKNPKISIIIPVYNTDQYLKNCLISVINQTYQNLEIICINDGSTDSSPEILQTYAKNDQRIKIINQKNQGLSSARNKGLEKATGSFTTFVDSDDQIKPQMIERMVNAIQETHSDIAVCSFQELYPNGKTTHFNHKYPQTIYDTKDALKAMLKEQGFMVSATMKLFPTKFFKTVKFPSGKLHEDVGTTYKLILQADTIVFIPYEGYLYIHHNDSIVNQGFDDRKFDLIELTDQMCDKIDQKYPDLKNTTNERRIRARFSLLRQIPLNHPCTKELLNYLKNHQQYITQNSEATKTDKIALKLALFNPNLFQIAYKLFK